MLFPPASPSTPFNPAALDYISSNQFQIPQAVGYGMKPTGPGFGDFGGPSALGKMGIGFNLPTLDLGLSGLKTLGSLWAAMQSAKIAKKQLNFTRDVTNTNLANQTQSYNTILADKARARGRVEGKSDAQVSDYIAQNSLAKRTI